MKYKVTVELTMHCNLPADALKLVQDRLRKSKDTDKIKIRKAVVKPIGRPSWHYTEDH